MSFKPSWNVINQTNPYALYVVSNWAHDLFKDLLKEKDLKNEYFRLSYVEGADPEEVKKYTEEYNSVYESLLQELEEHKHTWQQEHMEYYRIQACLPSSQQYLQSIEPHWEELKGDLADINLIMNAYKAANESLKSVPNSSLDIFCVENRPMLNIEHKPKYEEFVNWMMKSMQLPTLQEYLEQKNIKTVQVKKTRLSLNRQKCEDSQYFDRFVQMVSENLS